MTFLWQKTRSKTGSFRTAMTCSSCNVSNSENMISLSDTIDPSSVNQLGLAEGMKQSVISSLVHFFSFSVFHVCFSPHLFFLFCIFSFLLGFPPLFPLFFLIMSFCFNSFVPHPSLLESSRLPNSTSANFWMLNFWTAKGGAPSLWCPGGGPNLEKVGPEGWAETSCANNLTLAFVLDKTAEWKAWLSRLLRIKVSSRHMGALQSSCPFLELTPSRCTQPRVISWILCAIARET